MGLLTKEGLREELVGLIRQFGTGDVRKEKEGIYAKLDELYVVLRHAELFGQPVETHARQNKEEATENRQEAKKMEINKSLTFANTNDAGEEMERQLRGGVLKTSDTYVPESVIRNLGLENGDRVSARHVGGSRYHFSLIEKASKAHPTRRQLDRLVVDGFGGKLYASRFEDGSLAKVDGNPVTFYIQPGDIQKMSLKKGDVVDIAYHTDGLDRGVVIWRYNHPADHQKAPVAQPPVQKATTPKPVSSQTPSTGRPRVLLFGSESYSQAYGRRLNGLGMDMVFVDGEADLDASMLEKADIVMVVQFHTASPVNWAIRSELKKCGRTAHFLPSPLPESVEEQAMNALNEWKKNKTA